MEQTVQTSQHVFFVSPLFIFWVFSFALLGAAIGVVAMRNIIHCALSLALAFLCTAGLYVLLGAEFVAAAEVLIYAGAVTILVFFALMLSQRIIGRDIVYKNRQSIWASFVSLAMAAVLILILSDGNHWNYMVKPSVDPVDNTTQVGQSLMMSYTLAFWVSGLLLTISMIGSLILAKKD